MWSFTTDLSFFCNDIKEEECVTFSVHVYDHITTIFPSGTFFLEGGLGWCWYQLTIITLSFCINKRDLVIMIFDCFRVRH